HFLARDSFIDAIKQWERALSKNDSADTTLRNGDVSHVDDRNEKLEQLLDKAYQLRDEMNEFLNGLSPDILENYAKANRYLTYNDVNKKNARRTLSVLSDDSFASALEDLMPPILDLDVEINRPIESDVEELILYQEALGEVDALNVACRVL
uniref:Uncharacterized protein n=1 Tax=Romanomermis culicivorax TaxID=13658 RepID=A0A915ITN2_ROMCU